MTTSKFYDYYSTIARLNLPTHSHTLIVLFWENCRWIGLLHGPRTHHRVLKTNWTSKYTFWVVALSFLKKILDKERHIFNSCNKTFGKLLKVGLFLGSKTHHRLPKIILTSKCHPKILTIWNRENVASKPKRRLFWRSNWLLATF